MGVSAAAIRDFLESAKLVNSVSNDKLSRSLFLYERATKTTSVLTGMPGGGGSDRESVLANLADAKEDSKRWEDLARQQRERVKQFINEAEITDFQKQLLLRRYVMGLEWHFIFLLIREQKDMSESTMYREHNRALEACADWVNRTGKYKEEFEK